ncbi:hypothetical protein SEPCBS119000_000693 [Sporothrix epigloea]|uniref:DRBM domain-containing protein n=1 Tax=Sporothrix epigloea TaxID=1892477 RepID=A0ABP0D6K1_9PEZI
MGSQLPAGSRAVSYASLKAWIYDQEEYERRNGRPAPLTDDQLNALAVLVSPPPTASPAAPSTVSPTIPVTASLTTSLAGPQPAPVSVPRQATGFQPDTDFVSMLMRYVQAQKGGFFPPEYNVEQLSASNYGSPQWRTRCRLPRDAPDRWFPDVNEPRPQDSIFQNKKVSRQHAARCAIDWLIAEGRMSSSGEYIVPTNRSILPAQPIPGMAMGNTLATPARPLSGAPGTFLTTNIQATAAGNQSTLSVSSKTQPETSSALPPVYTVQSMAMWQGKSYANTGSWTTVVDSADNGIRAINNVASRSPTSIRNRTAISPLQDARDYECATKTQLLDSLCRKRKLGSPSYHLTPVSEDAQGIFDGHVEFTTLGTSEDSPALVLPEGVGKVCKIYTKKAAKEKLAESVLQYIASNMQGSVKA